MIFWAQVSSRPPWLVNSRHYRSSRSSRTNYHLAMRRNSTRLVCKLRENGRVAYFDVYRSDDRLNDANFFSFTRNVLLRKSRKHESSTTIAPTSNFVRKLQSQANHDRIFNDYRTNRVWPDQSHRQRVNVKEPTTAERKNCTRKRTKKQRAIQGKKEEGMSQDETLISRGGNIGPMIFEARVL